MKSSFIAKLQVLHERHKEIQALLKNTKVFTNQERFLNLSREYIQLNNIFDSFNEWKKIQHDIKNAQIMLNDPEMHELAQEEILLAKSQLEKITYKINMLLHPQDTNDKCNAFIEIRAGTGGNEAAIFAGNLFRMYSKYAESRRWQVEIINIKESEHGGYKEIIAKIIGNGVYGRLKFESGGHRVQRIPATESRGRVHTSTCTVAIMQEIPEAALPKINSEELRIDTFRSSGAGGQHVNTTDSAIRITHLPTGIVVECQDERSQHKNKAKALSVLSARIHAMETAKRQKMQSFIRLNLLGSGDRNDRNRSYNFPHGRITDHRINLTLYRLNEVMNGNLDILIDPITQKYYNNELLEIV